MKKIMVMLLACALAAGTLAACGGDAGDTSKDDASVVSSESDNTTSKTDDGSDANSTANKTVDMSALLAQIKSDFAAEERREVSEDDILDDTGINPASYDSYFWLTEISGLSSEKAAMFRAKDETSAAAIKSKLETVVQSELNAMKEYNADNYAMLQKAVVEQRGLYVYMLISPNVDKFTAAVEGAF